MALAGEQLVAQRRVAPQVLSTGNEVSDGRGVVQPVGAG
jgi:hypothetical protein